MGRFYSGDINGKFWFGVQSTYCMEEYGATFDKQYEFAFCRCCADGEDDGTDFCQDCFDSREEHLKAIEDDGEEDVTITTQEGGEVNFSMTREAFLEQGKPFIEKHAELFLKKEFELDEAKMTMVPHLNEEVEIMESEIAAEDDGSDGSLELDTCVACGKTVVVDYIDGSGYTISNCNYCDSMCCRECLEKYSTKEYCRCPKCVEEAEVEAE